MSLNKGKLCGFGFWDPKNVFNPIIEKLAILKKCCAHEECPYLMNHFTHVDETLTKC